MRDWLGYLKEHVNSDLWGFVLLDYYHQPREQGHEKSPSHFVDEVISELPKEVSDPVAFHNTLLSVCVHLLSPDFSAIMAKSINFLKSLQSPLTEVQLQAILAHYAVYGKHKMFEEKLVSLKAARNYKLEDEKIHPNAGKGATATIPSFPISEGFHQKLSPKFLHDPFLHAPLLLYYSRDRELVKAQPFKGKRIFFVLHFLRDFIPFVKAAINLGLDMENAYFFYKEYPYPQREAVKEWLEKQFINEKASPLVKPHSHIPQFLKQLAESLPETIGRILIIEDGGFFVPLIHREFPQLIPYIIGAVEQTSRGIRHAEDWEREKEENKLQFPIISVATSELKSKFEPPYIAAAVVDNIKQFLPHISLRGKTSGLFGFGTIGEKLAHWLRQNGVDMMIFEPDPGNRLQAHQGGFSMATSPVQAVQNKDFVIGTSGSQSINSQVIANLAHGTYVLSTSSELYEIDIEELVRKQVEMKPLINQSGMQIGTDFTLPPKDKVIHLLANGYPINFWGFDSMPEEASSFILTLILLSSSEVALDNYRAHGINSHTVNQIAKKYKVAEKFLELYGHGQ